MTSKPVKKVPKICVPKLPVKQVAKSSIWKCEPIKSAPKNKAPVSKPDTNWVKEDTHLAASGNVLTTTDHSSGAPSGSFADAADTDADVEPLTVTTTGTFEGTYGRLVLAADGSYTYTLYTLAEKPAAYAALQALDDNETLSESFAYTASDGTAASASSLTVTLFGTNDAPVVNADTNWVKEDTHLSASGNVLTTTDHSSGAPSGSFADAADTDADVEPLTVTTTGTFEGTYGRLVLAADGSYTYTLYTLAEKPAAYAALQALDDNETLSESFAYTASDGTAASASSLTVTLFGTNDAPVVNADTNWVKEDTHLAASGNVLTTTDHSSGAPSGSFADAADTDADVEPLTVTTTGTFEGTYGRLVLAADGSYTYTLYTLAEKPAAYAALQALDDNETLSESFAYTASDGTAASASSLTVTLFGTNDAPVVNADTNWVKEDTNLAASGNVLTTTDHSSGAPSGSFADAADTDADVEPLTVTTTGTFEGTYGRLVLAADGSYTYTLYTLAEKPAAYAALQALDDNETLSESFAYTASDGTAASASSLTVTLFGTNDAPDVRNTCVWMSSDPAQATASVPSYSDGYPLLVNVPTDIDGENITVTSNPGVPAGVFYNNGASFVALTTGTVLYDPSAGINLLDDLVYRPTATVNDTVTSTLSLAVTDGTATVTETVTITEVAPSRLPSAASEIGGGSSPLTSGNSQTSTMVLTQSFVDAINGNPTGSVIEVSTDFQNNPIVAPVPSVERNPGAFGDSSAGSHREQEVQVELLIAGNRFAIVEDDLTTGTFEQSWFFDSATGLMKASANYSNIFLLDGAGNATATTLADYLVANPPAAGQTWTLSYFDNSGGPYQARLAKFEFFYNDPGDPGISVNGDAVKSDLVYGTSGVDILNGNGGNDIILGRGNNDIINGGAGDDQITGGGGRDTITGGAGADTFIFTSIGDSSTLATADRITDFQEHSAGGGDFVDLSIIDAVAGGADNPFSFAGQNAVAVANSVTWYQSAGNTIIQADNTGDTTPDLVIILNGTHSLAANDLHL